MGFLLVSWFNWFLVWQPILLFIVGIYCIFKSHIITVIWDAVFPDAKDWDAENKEMEENI